MRSFNLDTNSWPLVSLLYSDQRKVLWKGMKYAPRISPSATPRAPAVVWCSRTAPARRHVARWANEWVGKGLAFESKQPKTSPKRSLKNPKHSIMYFAGLPCREIREVLTHEKSDADQIVWMCFLTLIGVKGPSSIMSDPPIFAWITTSCSLASILYTSFLTCLLASSRQSSNCNTCHC